MTASVWNPQVGMVSQANAQGLVKMEFQVALDQQRIFDLTTFAYAPNTGTLMVFKNGNVQVKGVDYLEATGTEILLAGACTAGDKLLFIAFVGVAGTAATDAVLRSDLAAAAGAINVGFQQTGIDAVVRTILSKARETRSLEDFGAVGDGVTDCSTAWTKALTYSATYGSEIVGASGSNYKVAAKGSVNIGGSVRFNGRNCLITNAINNAVSADPLIDITNAALSNATFENFRVAGGPNNGHIVSLVGALSTGPQFINLRNIYVQNSSGNGKDKTGAAIPACLIYASGGMSLKIDNCVTYLSGGIRLEQVLKTHISDTTIDSPVTGRLIYAKQCDNLIIDGDCVMNGGTTDQIELENCNGAKVIGNRLKGGSGRQVYAHGSSTGIAVEHNQQEVYNLTTNAIEITTAVASARVIANAIQFVNGTPNPVVFTKGGIQIVDEPGGGFISTGAVIESNTFVVNSLMTIDFLIGTFSTLNAVQRPRIESNSLCASGGGIVVTVNNGIKLAGNVIGATVEGNTYGVYNSNTMTNGINNGAGCTGTRMIENYHVGGATNPIVDAGVKTTRIEGGILVPIPFTPVLNGLSTTGAGTYSTQVGSYTQEGNIVRFDATLVWTAHTGTGAMVIQLPFTTANRLQVVSCFLDSIAFTGQVQAAISSSGNVVRLWSETTNAGSNQLTLDTAGTIAVSGVVEIA